MVKLWLSEGEVLVPKCYLGGVAFVVNGLAVAFEPGDGEDSLVS
jgi:hypothetical protein